MNHVITPEIFSSVMETISTRNEKQVLLLPLPFQSHKTLLHSFSTKKLLYNIMAVKSTDFFLVHFSSAKIPNSLHALYDAIVASVIIVQHHSRLKYLQVFTMGHNRSTFNPRTLRHGNTVFFLFALS